MIRSFRRDLSIYSAIAAIATKTRLTYNIWVWAEFVVTLISMIVIIYFWHAVYANTSMLGGLEQSQAITYILLARLLVVLVEPRTIFYVDPLIRQGQIAVELTRPLDMQLHIMIEGFAELAVLLVQRLPLFLIAWLFFGMHLPANPAVWLAFFVSLLLG